MIVLPQLFIQTLNYMKFQTFNQDNTEKAEIFVFDVSVTYNIFECVRYDYLLCFNVYVTASLVLLPF